MDEIINFIITHYRLIIEGFLLLLSVVIFILRKRPFKVIDGVREDLFKWCLAAVSYVEKSGITGSKQKLDSAIDYVFHNFMDKYYPNEEHDRSKFWIQYAELTYRYIEAILSTPQKHDER